jgi:transposase-like protein
MQRKEKNWMTSRRKFTQEFKLAAVERLRAGEPVGLLARSLDIPAVLH